MKSPNPPIQTPITGELPIQWRSFFTQLSRFLVGSPKSGEELPSYANDAAAATGGVPLWGYYRTGSTVKQRVS
jgi:hypothetical protein